MSPFARFDRLDPERRARILGAALDEFVANGYEGASINQIINAAEISKGSFYYYFEDKVDLFVAVIEDTVDFDAFMNAAGFENADDAQSFWAVMWEATEKSIGLLLEKPELVRLSEELTRLPAQVMANPHFALFYERASEYLVSLIVSGQRIGAIREDIPLPILIELWTSNERIVNQWLLREWLTMDDETRRVHMDLVLGLFKRLFAP